MDTLRLQDNEFLNQLNRNQEEIRRLNRAPQPFYGDWLQILEPLDYVDSENVEFQNASVVAKNLLSVGDFIRWKQAGDSNFRYGYVVSREDNNVRIFGGTDYPLANLAITEFHRGVTDNPIGHPILLDFDADIRAIASGSTYTNLDPNVYEITQFTMNGSLMIVRIDVSFGSMSGGTSPIWATPPVESNFLTYERRIISGANAFSFCTGLAKMGGPNTIEIYSDSNSLAGFSNTSNGLGFNISLEYVVA